MSFSLFVHCDLQRRGSFQWGHCFNIWQCLNIGLNLSEREDYLLAAGLGKFQAWTEFLDEQMCLYCQKSLSCQWATFMDLVQQDGPVWEYPAMLLWVNLTVWKVKLTYSISYKPNDSEGRCFLHICDLSCMIWSITHLAVLHFLDQACRNSVCAAISFLQT